MSNNELTPLDAYAQQVIGSVVARQGDIAPHEIENAFRIAQHCVAMREKYLIAPATTPPVTPPTAG